MEPSNNTPASPAPLSPLPGDPAPEKVTPGSKQLGSLAAGHEADTSGAGAVPGAGADTAQPTTEQLADTATHAGAPAPEHTPPGLTHPNEKTIRLPIPTSVLPALLIGVLILVLLLAVAAYAFI